MKTNDVCGWDLTCHHILHFIINSFTNATNASNATNATNASNATNATNATIALCSCKNAGIYCINSVALCTLMTSSILLKGIEKLVKIGMTNIGAKNKKQETYWTRLVLPRFFLSCWLLTMLRPLVNGINRVIRTNDYIFKLNLIITLFFVKTMLLVMNTIHLIKTYFQW